MFGGSLWTSYDAVAVLRVGVVSGRSKHGIVVFCSKRLMDVYKDDRELKFIFAYSTFHANANYNIPNQLT